MWVGCTEEHRLRPARVKEWLRIHANRLVVKRKSPIQQKYHSVHLHRIPDLWKKASQRILSEPFSPTSQHVILLGLAFQVKSPSSFARDSGQVIGRNALF